MTLMATGRKITLKGFKLDKYGKRVTRDPKAWDVSKQIRKAGAQKMQWGKKGRT